MNYHPDQTSLLKRIGLIILSVILVILLIWVQFKWWPWLMHRVDNATRDGEIWSNWRLGNTIWGGVYRLWAPHARVLLETEKELLSSPEEARRVGSYTEGVREMLVHLNSMPGVMDVFYLDFKNVEAESFNGVVSSNILLTDLDKRQKKYVGGRSGYGRHLVGGLNRIYNIKTDDNTYPVIVRYVDTFYPNAASEAIGLVLDAEWFRNQIPALLDSLARDDMNIALFSPIDPDTLIEGEDPYTAAGGGAFKQTLGVFHGVDTLWWYGDKSVKITRRTGWIAWLDEFGIDIRVKNEFPKFFDKIKAGKRVVMIVFPLLELIGIVLIVTLIISIRYTRQQAKRNKIALAHFAHAIKTPVARLRLGTDLLSEGHVSSPNDEQGLIKSISSECGRLELAVKNAAISLEQDKLILNKESCDLTGIVTNISEAWKVSFDQSGIALKIEKPDLPLQGQFDVEMISIMLDYLIDNALRHTYLNLSNLPKDTASVMVKLEPFNDNKVKITVDDSGVGIPQANRKDIFKRFQRTRGDALTGVSGLGLGLVLVNEIAEAHIGKVSVEEAEVGGARFVVELPVI